MMNSKIKLVRLIKKLRAFCMGVDYRVNDFSGLSIERRRNTSLILGCLSFHIVNGETRLVWRGEHIFISGVKKEVEAGRIIELVATVGDDGLDFLLARGYKFRFHGTNTDIIDSAGNMICRGNADELGEFMKYHRQTQSEKFEWLKTAKIDKESSKYAYNADETEKLLGERIPPSSPPKGAGLSPDFRGHPDYLYDGDLQFGNIELRMSGSRDVDFKILNDRFGFPDTPEGYVWHHLDEVWLNDAGELVCTMQLVSTIAHKKVVVGSLKGNIQALNDVIVAGEHVGSVGIWRSFYPGVFYK